MDSIEILLASVIVLLLWLIVRFRLMSSFISITGKAVFITGCDSGIGFETALLFDRLEVKGNSQEKNFGNQYVLHSNGFHVFAGCLYPDGKGAHQLKNLSSQHLLIIDLDVTDRKKIDKARRQIEAECQNNGVTFWCLINNAGICVGGEFEWLTIDQCETQVNVNLMGNIYITKAFLPLLRQSKGRIINITSVNGFWAYPSISVYCATKYALEGLSASLRMELRRVGISVVIVAPGDYARLTNIMKAQTNYAQEQWDAMHPDIRSIDGDYFWSVQDSINHKAGLLSPPSFKASPLMNDIKEAVLAVRPRNRYTSATRGYRIFLTLLGWFSIEWSDSIILWMQKRLLHSVKKTKENLSVNPLIKGK